MKSKLIICIAATVVSMTSTLLGQTSFDRDLIQLKEQRDRAIAAATEPINRRYKDSLEQLLRRATQGNDLDTALKIKTELGVATTSPAQPTTVGPVTGAQPTNPAPGQAIALSDLKLQLTGTRWKQLSYGSELKFRDGTAVQLGGDLGTYKVKSRDKVTLTFGKREEELELSKDGRHLEKVRNTPLYELLPPK